MRGTKLVSNVRKITEFEETEIISHPLKLDPIINEAVKFILKSLQTRNININLDTEEERNIYIKGNNFILDVIENILLNAVKHNNSTNVEIQINLSKEVIGEIKYIKLEISDNGMGIPDNRKDLIFQRGGPHEGKGMGLGLSLVKKIIDNIEGDIWVEDRVKGDYSKGSKFVVLFPEVLI